MVKIKPNPPIPEPNDVWVTVMHIWDDQIFGPGVWHCIYVYHGDELAPWTDAYQLPASYDAGILMSKSWASRPVMINAICQTCRAWSPGPSMPRWNEYRGWNIPRGYHFEGDPPPRLIPAFVQPWWEHAPPGYIDLFS